MPTLNVRTTDNVQAIAHLHMDLALAAFRADLTRVVVMQIGDQSAAHLIVKEAGFMGTPVQTFGDARYGGELLSLRS